MRAAAQETAPQTALSSCSEGVGGGGQSLCDFGHGAVHACVFLVESFCWSREASVQGNSHHHKGFSRFSRHEGTQELAHNISP